jgi:hypothetical protein
MKILLNRRKLFSRLTILLFVICVFTIVFVRSTPPPSTDAVVAQTQKEDPSPFQEVLNSSYNCDNGPCVFENVCVNQEFQLEYFVEDEALFPKPPVNMIGAIQEYWDKGRVNILQYQLLKPQEISTFVFSTPVYVQKMLAVGNFGHSMLQNVYPMLRMAVTAFGEGILKDPLQILLFNDCKNCGWPSDTCIDAQGSYGYSSCGFMKHQLYPLITGKPAIELKQFLEEKNQTRSCFRKLVIGMDDNYDMLYGGGYPVDYLVKSHGRDRVFKTLQLNPRMEKKDEILIMVYCKKAGRHGGAIANCDYILEIVTEHYNHHYHEKKLTVVQVNFDTLTDMSEQIRIVSKADIYICNGGSASYYSLFLRQGAVSMILPQCSVCTCYDIFPQARVSPNVTYIPIKTSSIVCPIDDCSAGDCNAQNLPLIDGFRDELDQAIQTAYHNINIIK